MRPPRLPVPASKSAGRQRSATPVAAELKPVQIPDLGSLNGHGRDDPQPLVAAHRWALNHAAIAALQRTHDNTHVQRLLVPVRDPRIQRNPDDKKRAAPAPGSSKFDGVLLGTNREKKEVRVKREVGGTQEYDDRLQAIAVARLANAEPAAVVLGQDGKWHAFETSAGFAAGLVSAPETAASGQVPFVEVHGLPSRSGISQARQRVDKLKIWLARLDAMEQEYRKNRPMLAAVKEAKSEAILELSKANQTRAAHILGVTESEIQFTAYSSGRSAGKVNIVGQPGKGSSGAAHGRVGGEGGFKPGTQSAFHIDVPELDDPAGAQAAMFHEVQHKRDYDFAQEWIKKYEAIGAIYVSGNAGRKPFEDWLNTQVKAKRLTKADVELIVSETFDDSAYTEARANVRTFLAALQAGAPDVAAKLLVAYAHALKAKKEGGGGQYASPATGSHVQAALVEELKATYKQMPETMKRQYEAAVAAAKNEYPSAWISALEIPKRARR